MKRRRTILVLLLLLMLTLVAVLGALLVALRSGSEEPTGDSIPGVDFVGMIYGWGEDPDSLLNEPFSVAYEGGFIYVTQRGLGNVVKLTPLGELDAIIGQKGRAPGEVYSPTGLDVDTQGGVYVSDGGHAKIVVYDSQGAFSREIEVEGTPLAPLIDGPRMFLTTTDSVKVLDQADGNELTSWGTRGKGEEEFDFPNGIGFDSDRQMLVVSDGNNLRVKALNLQGDTLWIYGKPPRSMNETDREFGLPGGLAMANGFVFVVDPLDSVIHILDMDGQKIGEVGQPGDDPIEFSYPSSIAYMGGNRFVVAEWGNQRLQILDIDAAQFAAALAEMQEADEQVEQGSSLTTSTTEEP